MNQKIVGAMLLFLASCGCRACDNSCDYLPPVLDGPYTPHSMRLGSAIMSEDQIPAPIDQDAEQQAQEPTIDD